MSEDHQASEPRVVRALPAARRVVICQNPQAGSGRRARQVDELIDLLRGEGLRVDPPDARDAWWERAHRYSAQGELRAVVAAGGDGTAGRVLNETGPGTPIAVLPLGTENLLAKYLGMPANPRAVALGIVRGEMLRVDAGRANGRLFLLMASCGLDAEVVHRLHKMRRGHIGHLSYAKPILDSLRSYQYPELRVHCDPPDGAAGAIALPAVTRARWAFVMNLPVYALGLQIVPQADGNDGLLDVCTFRRGSLYNGLWYLGGVILGQHQLGADCTTWQASCVRVESDDPVPYQIDGDPGGVLPLTVEIVRDRGTVIRPPARAACRFSV